MYRALLIVAMCIGLVGCQFSTAPVGVGQYDRGHGVAMSRAPWNGEYTLYLFPSGPKGQRTAVQTAHLKKGDPLGFRQRQDGVVAVAGELEVPLRDGRYQWVMKADPGQANWLGTAAIVLLTAAVVFGVIAVLAYIDLNKHF